MESKGKKIDNDKQAVCIKRREKKGLASLEDCIDTSIQRLVD